MTTTDLTGYDIVMAVTIGAVNDALYYSKLTQLPINYNYSMNPPPGTAPLPPGTPQSQCDGLFNAKLAGPVLSLVLPDGSPNTHQVSVLLKFSQGTLQTFNRSTGEVSTDVTDWTIQFTASLAVAPVQAGVDLSGYPQDVQTSLQAALSNPALSVTQLFLDLAIVNWPSATVMSPAGAVTDAYTLGVLEGSLQLWCSSLDTALSQAVLGWMQASKDAGNTAAIPAFVPTSYGFSVSPYNPSYDTTANNPTGATDPDLGTINYLMMTQNKAAPTSNTAGIFSTNWVPLPNTLEYQGTLCMTNALFTSGFITGNLLPAIAQAFTDGINSAITEAAKTAPTGTDGQATSYQVGASSTVENNSNEWTISQGFTVNANQWCDKNGENCKGLKLSETLIHTISVYEQSSGTVSCTVQFNPQADPPTFVVNGAYNGDLTMTEIAYDVPVIYSSLYQQLWSFSITLQAQSNGTILASASDVTLGAYSLKTKGDDFLGTLEAGLSAFLSNFMDTYANQFQDAAKKLADASVTNLGAALGTAMTALSACVIFPGAKNYSFKSLAFSTEGEDNLLSNVTFKD
jgi:hypothetical protein